MDLYVRAWPPYPRLRDRLLLKVIACDLRTRGGDAQMLSDFVFEDTYSIVSWELREIVRALMSKNGDRYDEPAYRFARRLWRVRLTLYIRALSRAHTPPDLDWGYEHGSLRAHA